MGHLTALGSTVDEALERAREAAAALDWAEGVGDDTTSVSVATSEVT
jgi:flavin-binding protein dodecin